MAQAAVRDYPRLAKDVVALVGGDRNILAVSRCATRLRLVLAETPPQAKDQVSALPGVITVVDSGGQFQVVIGTHVGKVYDQVALDLDLENNPRSSEQGKQTVLNKVIATMSASIAPFVYVLAAAGLLQGSLILIKLVWPEFEQTGTYEVLSFISWTPFTFLPILISLGAAKHFRVNAYIAMTCAAALVNPTWAAMAGRITDGEPLGFLGIPLNPVTYTSSVLPIIFLVWLMSYLEHYLDAKLPAVIKPLLTPFVCLVVMIPLTLLVVGPITTWAANGVASLYNLLADSAPAVAAAFVGFFWQVLVIFGVHWGMTPVMMSNLEELGSDSMQAYLTAAVIGQVGATVGVLLKSRNHELRGVAGSAAATGFFGITEPAIYGVTLRLKKPFILGCTAGAIGAVVMSLFHTRNYVYAGLAGPLTIINAHSADNPSSLWGAIFGNALAFVLGIVLVYMLGFTDPVNDLGTAIDTADQGRMTLDAYQAAVRDGGSATVLGSPLAGAVIALDKVADPVFGSGAMGQGVAIEPIDGKVHAPVDGSMTTVFRTKHALGITSDDGLEILIHVGMDTVQLEGQHFTAHVEQGQRVRKGELLLEFDIPAIEAAGYSLVTPIVVTNLDEHSEFLPYPTGKVEVGAELATVIHGPALAAAGISEERNA
ncbi:MAG: beta-glucoside-specific PTS transporter subunit IIABC [Candidatus Nanopelagicales bacterium]